MVNGITSPGRTHSGVFILCIDRESPETSQVIVLCKCLSQKRREGFFVFFFLVSASQHLFIISQFCRLVFISTPIINIPSPDQDICLSLANLVI